MTVLCLWLRERGQSCSQFHSSPRVHLLDQHWFRNAPRNLPITWQSLFDCFSELYCVVLPRLGPRFSQLKLKCCKQEWNAIQARLKLLLFSTCLLFGVSLVPLLVSGADLSGPGDAQPHMCLGREGRFIPPLYLYWPLGTRNYSPTKLVLCLAEKGLFCGQLYMVLFEGYWKGPGLNVILYTTPIGFHCS